MRITVKQLKELIHESVEEIMAEQMGQVMIPDVRAAVPSTPAVSAASSAQVKVPKNTPQPTARLQDYAAVETMIRLVSSKEPSFRIGSAFSNALREIARNYAASVGSTDPKNDLEVLRKAAQSNLSFPASIASNLNRLISSYQRIQGSSQTQQR